jgi:sugar lactone lactonase YvrE
MPNCLEYEKFTPKIALLDKNGKKSDWFVTLPLHPKTGKVHPMGMEFGPDGNLYVSDNQYFDDKDHQSRILRVIVKDGKPVSCEVAVEGTKLSNAIRFKGRDLYLTDTFFDLPGKRDQSGVWRFSLDEIGAGKPVVKVKPLGKDPHIIATFTAKPQPAKADGTFDESAGADGAAFDSAGNLYVGLFGDGQFFKITFKPDGSVKSNVKIMDDPSFNCCDGIWCDPKTDKIYMANSARNSIHIYDARNHTLQMIWQNADTDGKDGLLDQPCTACLLGNKLVIVNFDMPFPGLGNTTHDDPITVSYIEMP